MKHELDPHDLDATHVRDDRPTCASPVCDQRVPYRGEFCQVCRLAIEGERMKLRNTRIVTNATRAWLQR